MPGDKAIIFQIVVKIEPAARPANSAVRNHPPGKTFLVALH
jgi:hypothetical protein